MGAAAYEFAPSILPSPALGPFHPGQTYPSWPASTTVSANTSPAIKPRQGNGHIDADVDHEASAALLMLNQDRRGTIDSVVDKINDANLDTGKKEAPETGPETGRRMGMSVRDLLVP